MLPPFRFQSAEAVTTDGIEWDIYVANDALLDGLGRARKSAQNSAPRHRHRSAGHGRARRRARAAAMARQDNSRVAAIAVPSEPAGVYLTRYVNSLASGVAQWFRRSDDGDGLGLHTLKGSDELRGRVLGAEAFPPLFIATPRMAAAPAPV